MIVLGLCACMLLTSCMSITRKIQQSGNTPYTRYPAAHSSNPAIEKPPVVNLSKYRSIHAMPGKNNDIAIALAASGGGYRAANLTLGVLLGLEKLKNTRFKHNLLQGVDYFSTVSGGGFGVGYYLTQRHNYYMNSSEYTHFSLNEKVKEMLENDSIAVNPLRQDLTQYLFFGKKRGFEFEKKINDTLLATPQGGLKLGDIFVPDSAHEAVHMPYWVPNATIFQNAALFPFTPDILSRYQVFGFYHDNRYYEIPGQYSDSRYAYDVPLSVAVKASASVPFAITPTTLFSDGCDDNNCYLQLLDGGLVDNLGVYTALNLLLQDKSKIKVLIVVDASKSSGAPYSQMSSPPESSALFWRLLTASTDTNRERIKPNIDLVTRDLLCAKNASHVIVVYLDLSKYPEAQRIGTQFSMTSQQQQYLLKIGQELITNNQKFQTFLAELNQNKLILGKC